MTDHVQIRIQNGLGEITLDRPKALNSLSLDMVRAISTSLLSWRNDPSVHSVLIRSSSERALCAGGDIRFFYDTGRATPQGGSALLEDFFSEEYALNHLIHFFPKPYIALMDGIVMGGGMGIAQGGPQNQMRIVTERTKMAMPEVNIGLFPDVGGSYFLPRAPGEVGTYLGITGEVIGPTDALHAELADVFVPTSELPALYEVLRTQGGGDLRAAVRDFAAAFAHLADPDSGPLAGERGAIDRHFSKDTVQAVTASLAKDSSVFAQKTLAVMATRSPLMMCVTLAQLRLGAGMSVAECLRMERSMVRRSFEHGEVLEGVRALVIDKDNAPRWCPSDLNEVSPDMIARFFEPVWPEHAHPLRDL